MPVYYQNNSITSEPTSLSQPSIIRSTPAGNYPSSRFTSDSDDSGSGDKDGVYLFNVLSPETRSPEGDVAVEVKELARVALEKLLLAIPLTSYNPNEQSPKGQDPKGDIDKCLPERARKRLSTCYSEKPARIEQRLAADGGATVVVGSSTLETHHLACPFYIRQKDNHLNCLTRADLREIKDLKQHLWTAHRQPSYCPTCHDTYILSEDWENHVRLRSCISSGKPRPEGISALQMQLLARRADPWVSREVQWLLIWDIVFPGVELPSLPFLFGEVETLVWTARDFWSAEGDRIVCGYLAERQQTHQPQDGERNALTLGSLVLNCVIDQLVAACRQNDSDEQQIRGRPKQKISSWPSFWPW